MEGRQHITLHSIADNVAAEYTICFEKLCLSKQQIVYSAEFGRMPQAEAELKGTAATFRRKPSAALGLNVTWVSVVGVLKKYQL